MKRLFFALILIVYLSNVALANNTATGIVFDDRNSNGKMDSNESGIENVCVSNGVDVVMTDKNGKYSIPVSDNSIIFVIKPADYMYPVNEEYLTKFYYINKPNGSPKLKYPGSNPTGKLPNSIDFPLIKTELREKFNIAVFSDPQINNLKQAGYYENDIVDDLISSEQRIDFGITLGDIVNDQLELLPVMNKATSKIKIPWFHVTGNHDMNFDVENYKYANETFESIYGPTTYSFNHGNVHFIVLNDIIYPNSYTNHSYVGGLRDEHLKYLENSLRFVPKDKLIVLFMHIPLYNEREWGETFLSESRKKLFSILKDYEFTFSLSGHTHTQRHYFFHEKDGWLNKNPHHHYTVATASGDWWSGHFKDNKNPVALMRDGTPNGYNILSFSGNKYKYDFKAASYPASYKMRLYGPKKVKSKVYNGGNLYVNYFQGSEKDSVFYSINDGEWKSMIHTFEFDPFNCAARFQWDNSNKLPNGDRPSAPDNSTHLWKTSRIPTNLPLGENTIRVKVKDFSGNEFYDTFKFEVEENE